MVFLIFFILLMNFFNSVLCSFLTTILLHTDSFFLNYFSKQLIVIFKEHNNHNILI
ncbi:MAG: hypothetical protein PWP54_1558 [Thermosipho sp. (in: thermotogales)]|nr:hypothetical protein [Thermosipho sp. (in: thermotogales)]MDN5324997.1 hypothetical protein [Thermosipho sp. (in: thermotogales)]